MCKSSWPLGRLQKQDPRLKARNVFKIPASNLDSGTFQRPTNIRVKVRQTGKVGAKVDKECAPGCAALSHWVTMSSGHPCHIAIIKRQYARLTGQRHIRYVNHRPQKMNGKQKMVDKVAAVGLSSLRNSQACLSGNSPTEV